MADRRLLIDATKLAMPGMDGCKRYVTGLVRGLLGMLDRGEIEWQVDLHLGRTIVPIQQIREVLDDHEDHRPPMTGRLSDVWHSHYTRVRSTVRGWAVGTAKSILPDPIYTTMKHVKNRFFVSAVTQERRIPDYDLIHLTLPTSYPTFARWNRPLLTTVHDLCHLRYPQFQQRATRRALGKAMDLLVARRTRFLTVSESTRRDLLTKYAVPPEAVRTVPIACNSNRFKPMTDESAIQRVRRRYGLPPGPYLLTLSTIEPRKNLINTVDAFSRLRDDRPDLNVSLVIAGAKGWKTRRLFRHARARSRSIHFTGFVDEADLPALYSGSLALSYVSFYEGFGLPLLEAMSCGTAVLYGDNSSMPEVVGEAGLAANPNDIDQIKSQMARLVLDNDLRAQLAQRALMQAARFSWSETARQTTAEYDRLISNSPHVFTPAAS